MKKFTDITFAIVVGIPIFLFVMTILVITAPFNFFLERKFKKGYVKFLAENNGKNFFCYNNRKNAKPFIEKDILPELSKDVEIVYLNGKTVESKYDSGFISRTLNQLKNYNHFPHLMKIRDGKLIDQSINNSFYNVLRSNNRKNELLSEIDQFFELNGISKSA